MKRDKLKKLHDMSHQDLGKSVLELRTKMAKSVLSNSGSEPQKTHELGAMKQELATLLTLIQQKSRETVVKS